jgi:K+-transporting ATPase KdpF subunit
MSLIYWVVGFIAFGLLIYVFVALLNPEIFG